MSSASIVEGIETNFNNKDEAPTRSLSSRAKLRDQMQHDVETFLKSGGKVSHIENNVMADPPRKPKSDYGSRPI